ncbi:Uncharacterised protein [Stenotrophomonas maltophilia]|nr:Uncharacterised protein [Stenotrophomonas maltophilia]
MGQATRTADGAAQRGIAGHVGNQRTIVGDVTGNRTCGAAVADLQRATRIDGGAAGVAVVADQGQHASSGLGQRASATDRTADRGVATDIEHQAAVVGDVAGDRAGRTAIADLQRATGIDGGAAGIGVVAGHGQRAAAGLGQATGAADGAAQRGVAGHVGHQHTVVGDVTDDRTGRTAIADLQRATGIDGGTAGVGVVAGQHQCAAASLGEAAAAADHAAHGCRGTEVVDQAAIVGDVAQHRTGAAAVADLQRATTVDGGATGIDVVAAQGQRAGTALHQTAGATEHTAEGGAAVVAAGGQGRPPQQHAGSGHAGQASDALAATGTDVQRAGAGQVHRAGTGQGAARAHRQRAAVDGGGAGVAAGAGQGQRGRAILDQTARAGNRAGQGQVIAAQHVEIRTRAKSDVVGQRHRRIGIQRAVARHSECTAAQRCVVADHQPAGVEGDTASEGVRTAQRLHARPVLDQRAGATDDTVERGVADAAEGQRVAAQRHVRARHARQRADALVTACGDIKRGAGIGQGDRTGRRQAAAGADRQRAGIDGGTASEGVGAGQGLGTGAFLDQPAGAAHGAAEGAVGGIAYGQRVGAQIHRAIADQRAELLRTGTGRQIEGRAAGQVDDAAGMQAGPGPQRQRAGIDEGATGVGVGAVQGQRRQAFLGKRAGAAEVAVEGQVIAAQYGQASIENEVVAQGDRAVGIKRGSAAHGHRAGTQRGVVAHHQATGIKADASTESIGTGQCLHAGTVLDQSTATADHAVVCAVGHAAQCQRIATQRHVAAGHTGQRTDALVATAGDIQRAGTGKIHRAVGRQAAAGTDGQRAAVDGGTAGVGVGAGQGHRSRTILDQATVTTDDATQRERVAAEQVEVGTGGEADGIAKRHRQAAVQRRIGTDVQRAATQCSVVADHQPATVQGHAAAEQVGAAERENARAVLDQTAGTGNRAIEGAAADAPQNQ